MSSLRTQNLRAPGPGGAKEGGETRGALLCFTCVHQGVVHELCYIHYLWPQSTATELYKRLAVGREGRWLFTTP